MPVEHTKGQGSFMDKVIRPDGKWDWPQFFREINNILNGLLLAVTDREGFKLWQLHNGINDKKPTSILSEPYEGGQHGATQAAEPQEQRIPDMEVDNAPDADPEDNVERPIPRMEEASANARNRFNTVSDPLSGADSQKIEIAQKQENKPSQTLSFDA